MGLTRHKKIMIAVLLSGSLLVVLSHTMLSPALPSIMNDLSVGATTVQWLVSGYSLTEAIIIPLSAWMIGRFRTRHMFITGMLLFMCGSIVAICAPVFPLLLAGRLMQSVAAGIVMPMVFTLIVLIFPREKRGAGLGLVGLIMSFAPAVGPSLGGFLVDLAGWRSLFIMTASIALIVVLFALKFLESHEGFKRTRFDLPSVILSTLGLVSFLYGVSSASSAENIALSVGLMVVGAVLIGLFIRRQYKLEVPLLRLEILKVKKYRISIIAVVTLQAALIGSGVVFPLYIQGVLGYSATASGLVMMPGALCGAIAGLVAGRLFDRYGVRGLVLSGAALILVSAVGLVFFAIDSSLIFVLATYTLFGFSIQLIITPVNTWGLNSLSNEFVQHANAVTNTTNQIVVSIGTALIVSMSALSMFTLPEASAFEQMYTGYHYSFIAVAAIVFVAFCVVVFLVRDRKGEPATERERIQLQQEGDRTVRSTMNASPCVISEDAKVSEAIRVFAEANSSGSPLVNEQHEVVGFLSTGDILKYLGDIEIPGAEAAGVAGIFAVIDDEDFASRVSHLFDLSVTDIATRKVICIEADTSLEKACTILANRSIKKLPVVEEGKLVGVISRKNVMGTLAKML